MDIPEVQREFAHYLNAWYTRAYSDHIASEVFYVYRHNIGMPFREIFLSEQSMEDARKLLIAYFENMQRPRKNPKNHASVHYSYWQKFKEFLDSTEKTLP